MTTPTNECMYSKPEQGRVYAVTNKSPWQTSQIERLEFLISLMMEEFSHVDMEKVSKFCNHSIASCSAKASSMGLKYVVKKQQAPIPYQRPRKADMKNLPKHRNGRKVSYE